MQEKKDSSRRYFVPSWVMESDMPSGHKLILGILSTRSSEAPDGSRFSSGMGAGTIADIMQYSYLQVTKTLKDLQYRKLILKQGDGYRLLPQEVAIAPEAVPLSQPPDLSGLADSAELSLEEKHPWYGYTCELDVIKYISKNGISERMIREGFRLLGRKLDGDFIDAVSAIVKGAAITACQFGMDHVYSFSDLEANTKERPNPEAWDIVKSFLPKKAVAT